MVELKNGETLNGHLVNLDTWMNLNLRTVTRTSRDGDQFWKVSELFVRGNTVKYLRIPDKVADIAVDNMARDAQNRGRHGGRGRGRGRGRGGRGRGRGRHNNRRNQQQQYDSD